MDSAVAPWLHVTGSQSHEWMPQEGGGGSVARQAAEDAEDRGNGAEGGERAVLRAERGSSYLWLPSLGLPGFRCASVAALPAVLIFSCLPGLETAFRALEEVLVVAAAVDMDGRAR